MVIGMVDPFRSCPGYCHSMIGTAKGTAQTEGPILGWTLRERKWESDGVQKSKFEVIARDVRFLPKRD